MAAEKTKTLPLPPVVGAIALVGGIVLLVMGTKRGIKGKTFQLRGG